MMSLAVSYLEHFQSVTKIWFTTDVLKAMLVIIHVQVLKFLLICSKYQSQRSYKPKYIYSTSFSSIIMPVIQRSWRESVK